MPFPNIQRMYFSEHLLRETEKQEYGQSLVNKYWRQVINEPVYTTDEKLDSVIQKLDHISKRLDDLQDRLDGRDLPSLKIQFDEQVRNAKK